MICLKIVCWAYLLFMMMGTIANYNKGAQKNMAMVRLIDNVMIAIMITFLIILHYH